MTEDIRNQAAYDDQTHLESIVDWRETDDALLELRVRWLGFTPAEDTWEPIDRLHEDQPELVERFLRQVQRECDLAPVLLEKKWVAFYSTWRRCSGRVACVPLHP